ncbi:Sulfate adenylyltransferase subunit 2 [Frankliniella fusca]|uniref:Sulfate adenylyltransferase subunit 2 n=1 Tax=Frankliniella fusca TaxID=407009 RepID=A0AAE1LI92_9NEOP|nr:Sulfate adenylyltransferase subunit 2 [Frankliniella fusca]
MGPFKTFRGSDSELKSGCGDRVIRPAPQRILYQPHEFQKGLELLIKHRPHHPSGQPLLKILAENMKGREIPGLQTFISTKLRNELMNGVHDDRLRTLDKAQRLYIEGTYMKGVQGFKKPKPAADSDFSSDESPQKLTTTKEVRAFFPALNVTKKKIIRQISPEGGSCSVNFMPTQCSTPTEDKMVLSSNSVHKIVRKSVVSVLKEEKPMLMAMVKELFDSYVEEKGEKEAKADSALAVPTSISSNDPSVMESTASNECRSVTSASNISKKSTVAEEGKSRQTSIVLDASLSDSVLGRISLDAGDTTNARKKKKLTPTSNHLKDLSNIDGDSSDDDVCDARVSTITLVEVFRKRTGGKRETNFKARATKKGFQLSPKNLVNWSTTAAAGSSTPGLSVAEQLLADVPQLDIRKAIEESEVSVNDLKVTAGKFLGTKLGSLFLSAEKKIPAILLVKEDE